MFERIKAARYEEDGGFTLIELLVVIAILGILAAIVVFSVAGVTDRGQLEACKIDTQTLQTAEEANFAAPASSGGGQYVPMTSTSGPSLITDGFLSTASNLHGIVVVPPTAGPPATPQSYYINEASTTCGVPATTGATPTPADSVGMPPPGTPAPVPSFIMCGSGTASGPGGWGDC